MNRLETIVCAIVPERRRKHGSLEKGIRAAFGKETDMIRKVKDGYRVISHRTGRNLGTYATKPAAEKRVKQLELQGKRLAKMAKGKKKKRK